MRRPTTPLEIQVIMTKPDQSQKSESALQAGEDETRQVAMGTQYAPDRPSAAMP